LGAVALLVGTLILGSTAAVAATDLKSLLAPPPSSDWIRPASGRWLLGPFTAQEYGVFADQISGTPGNAANNLLDDGFVNGYGDAWVETTTSDQLVERVFEFGTTSGASDWFSGVKVAGEALKARKADIGGAAQIPNSFGVDLVVPDGEQWRVDFRKGNLVFVVHANAPAAGEDLSALAVSQALDEYKGAPAGTGATAFRSAGLPGWVMPVGGGVIGAIFIATAGTILLIWLTGRRRPAASAGAHLSPDGRYWWDGTTWRPTGPGP
jgi:hypothetical protein